VDATVLNGMVPVAALRRNGFRVVPWTTNDPEKMRAIIRLGVDGLISDRPDLLQQVLAEERASSPDTAERLKSFHVSGHRGARGLRPENTLPAFEAGLDNLIDTIEADIGITADHVSLIWHDQFLNPQSCRRADGTSYAMENRVYIRDITMDEAQASFICDKLHFDSEQKNDLALSPVAVAFAAQEHLISPYVPTYVEQLFRFTVFYAEYYRNGPGEAKPHAKERATAADRVHFNLETKILPENLASVAAANPNVKVPPEMLENHTVGPQVFVDTLCGAIKRNKMQARANVLSFDFRTLLLVQEQYPDIQTYYLTESPAILSTDFVPAALRV
ncbi:MAG TPA: glycerophosphodiester phosphodiesterase family protein, partial [Acidobacteriaceae bacterium]|nr:glycerophosphodiester phosphodiesterase family protein [Acidobacteriaceae bacterium]